MRWLKKGLSLCIFFLALLSLVFFVRFLKSPLFQKLMQSGGPLFARNAERGQEYNLQTQLGKMEKKLWEDGRQKNGVWIAYATVSANDAQMQMPLELFVAGCVAGSMDAGCEPEALRAQAVVIRTQLAAAHTAGGQNVVSPSGTGQRLHHQITVRVGEYPYMDTARLRRLWKKDYAQNYCKILTAVAATGGIIMTDESGPIHAPFCGMSAGRTRDAGRLLGEEYGSVKSVLCNENLAAADFLQTERIAAKSFTWPQECERDADGYLLRVKLSGIWESGEAFRKRYQMQSANMYWEKDGSFIILTSRGIGHGFGFDEYYGNCLAKSGKNSFEILQYFFQDISFQKIEAFV